MLDVIIEAEKVIDVMDKSDTVIRLKELKHIIDNDKEIKELLCHFSAAKNEYNETGYVTPQLLEAKANLYNHPVVAEYRTLYGDLNKNFMMLNNKLTSLLRNKRNNCQNN